MGLSNTEERNLSHKLRFPKNEPKDLNTIRFMRVANGVSYPPEMFIFGRKVKNWREFFSIKEPYIKFLYDSKKKSFIYLGKKDLTSPFHGLTLSMEYYCSRKNGNLTAVIDEKAQHRMHPYYDFNRFYNLKKTIEQWIVYGDNKDLNFSYPLKKLKCQ